MTTDSDNLIELKDSVKYRQVQVTSLNTSVSITSASKKDTIEYMKKIALELFRAIDK